MINPKFDTGRLLPWFYDQRAYLQSQIEALESGNAQSPQEQLATAKANWPRLTR